MVGPAVVISWHLQGRPLLEQLPRGKFVRASTSRIGPKKAESRGNLAEVLGSGSRANPASSSLTAIRCAGSNNWHCRVGRGQPAAVVGAACVDIGAGEQQEPSEDGRRDMNWADPFKKLA